MLGSQRDRGHGASFGLLTRAESQTITPEHAILITIFCASVLSIAHALLRASQHEQLTDIAPQPAAASHLGVVDHGRLPLAVALIVPVLRLLSVGVDDLKDASKEEEQEEEQQQPMSAPDKSRGA